MSDINNNQTSIGPILGGIAAIITAIGGVIGAWMHNEHDPVPNPLIIINPAVSDSQRKSFEPERYKAVHKSNIAVLTASTKSSKINVRSGPGMSYRAEHYGIEGDLVSLLDSDTDSQGATWFKVKFPASGADGWIREDFISRG